MLTTRPSFDQFLRFLLPGAIFVAGTWYINRPFLALYFPTLAGAEDTHQISNSLGDRAIILLLAAVCTGALLSHNSDLGIVSATRRKPHRDTLDKHSRFMRALWRIATYLFVWKRCGDYRVIAVGRYLDRETPRKTWFLNMAHDWANSDEDKLNSPNLVERENERIRCHQHVTAHLVAFSDAARSTVGDLQAQLSFAGALFLTFWALFFISLFGFATSRIAPVKPEFETYRKNILLILTGALYLGTFFASWVVKRRLRQFCSQVLLYGMHFHRAATEKSSPSGNHEG